MADPKPFQVATVEAALRAFRRKPYRFLVADEVGLGKTLVAQEIIRRMIARKNGPTVVIYVCSNLSIAAQNRKKLLELIPETERGNASCRVDRLALMPITEPPSHSKLHLYTLTPDTSIPLRKNRRRDGRQEERALIHCLVESLWPELLGGAGKNRFQRIAKTYWSYVLKTQRRHLSHKPDIIGAFRSSVRKEFDLRPRQHVVPVLSQLEDLELIARLRNALAACAIESMRPDLIIFDEFQNFRDLTDAPPDASPDRVEERLRGGGGQEKIPLLLLSATPYQLYTRNRDMDAGKSHHCEFFSLVEFLHGGGSNAKAKRQQCEKLFSDLQAVLRRPKPDLPVIADLREKIQTILHPVMARTERASHPHGWLEHNTKHQPAPLHGRDIQVYRHFSEAIADEYPGAGVPYWSSIPLPAQTMGPDYKVWERARKMTSAPSVPNLKKAMRDSLTPLEKMPHPKIRSLVEYLGIQNLLLPWLKPSFPWWSPGGAWKKNGGTEGKLLLFSRFRAVPKAVAALLSYTAECHSFQKNGVSYEDLSKRRLLQPGENRNALLAYFHPSPWLIQHADPLANSDRQPSRIQRALRAKLTKALASLSIRVNPRLKRNRSVWKVLARIEGRAGIWRISRTGWREVLEELDRDGAKQGLGPLLDKWDEQASVELSEISPRELDALSAFAFHAPGVAIGRALWRHWPDALNENGFTDTLRVSWQGLRTYLDNPLFAEFLRGNRDYPAAIMEAVRDGNLEAAIDEQLWLLKTLYSHSGNELAKGLLGGLQLRSGQFHLHELVGDWKKNFPLRCHVALPFSDVQTATVGGIEATNKPLRTDGIRHAFNSPFWPHVLATTSVGQEGLDFHTWCSNLAHWDLPHNPVDLEQREGRIQRFAGHSVRREIARRLSETIWKDLEQGESPWDCVARLADSCFADKSGLAPWWVFRGAEIDRIVFDVPTSEQHYWLESMKEQRMLYRLALGQPNQEDLLMGIAHHANLDRATLRQFTLELSPWFRDRR